MRKLVFILPAILIVLAACGDTSDSGIKNGGGYDNMISEEYLRSQFSFAPGAKLKHSECKKNSYPTCTYIWGVESEKDAVNVKYDLPPSGNKLRIVYAQASKPADFERVLSTYSKAESIDGIGVTAVWSGKQLSFITKENLIVHVSINEKDGEGRKEKATAVAKHVLENL